MAKTVSTGHKTWQNGSVMNYKITDEGVLYVSGCLCDRCEVNIRSKASFHHLIIEDGVTFIGSRNFKGMAEIKELTLPSSVIRIGDEAFSCCSNLSHIRFSEGLQTIGKEAFDTCDALTELHIPDSVVKVDVRAFIRCRSIIKLTFPKNLEYISEAAFAGCEALSKICLPDGICEIRDAAFESCSSLVSVSFPKNLRRIGPCAFNYCDNMPDVILPSKDVQVGKAAFGWSVEGAVVGSDGMEYKYEIWNRRCSNYDVVIKPSGRPNGDISIPGSVIHNGKEYKVTRIDGGAFSRCRELTSVVLPDSMSEIRPEAFLGCDNLRKVHTGKSLRRIFEHAFQGCKRLYEITIPDSIEYVSRDSFDETKLTRDKNGAVYVEQVFLFYEGCIPPHTCIEIRSGTTAIAAGAFIGQSNLEEVILPNGIKSIGPNAFSNCTGLKRINIPKSLTNIGFYAFSRTPQLKEVSFPWSKAIELDMFEYDDEKTIYIPKGTTELYMKRMGRKKFRLIEK